MYAHIEHYNFLYRSHTKIRVHSMKLEHKVAIFQNRLKWKMTLFIEEQNELQTTIS